MIRGFSVQQLRRHPHEIATWNVNSPACARPRCSTGWRRTLSMMLCLQEPKLTEDKFRCAASRRCEAVAQPENLQRRGYPGAPAPWMPRWCATFPVLRMNRPGAIAPRCTQPQARCASSTAICQRPGPGHDKFAHPAAMAGRTARLVRTELAAHPRLWCWAISMWRPKTAIRSILRAWRAPSTTPAMSARISRPRWAWATDAFDLFDSARQELSSWWDYRMLLPEEPAAAHRPHVEARRCAPS